MPPLDAYTIIVPELWKMADEWRAALEEADGAEKHCVLVQLRAVNLLKTIRDAPATPERLAWMTLWTRVFSLLDGVRGALDRHGVFAIDILARAAFESVLHTQAIIEPVIQLHELEKSKLGRTTVAESARRNAWTQAIDQLRAYTAWCLWADRRYCEELGHPRTQDGIWDPDPVRAIAADPESLRAFEAFHGPLDLRNEHDLERDRLAQEAGLQARRERLDTWLADARLKSWVAKLTAQSVANPTGASFFSLLFDDQRSIASRLGRRGERFAYFRYMRGSLLLHGSTCDEMMHVGKTVLAPAFSGDDEDTAHAGDDVANSCNLIVLGLFLMQKHVWPNGV